MHRRQDENQHVGRRAADIARGSAALPLNVLRLQGAFDDLKPSYRGWLDQTTPGDHEVVMGVVGFVLSNCAMRESHTTITALSVPALRTMLEFVETQFPETLENTKMEMVGFLEFVDESDEFTGSDELFEGLYDLVEDEDGSDWLELYAANASPFGAGLARSHMLEIGGPRSPEVAGL